MLIWHGVQMVLAIVASFMANYVNQVHPSEGGLFFYRFFIVLSISQFALAMREKVLEEYKFRLAELYRAEINHRVILDCKFTVLVEKCSSSEVDSVWQTMKPYYDSINIIYRKTFTNIMFRQYKKIK